MKRTLAALPLACMLAAPISVLADNGAGCGLGQQIFAGQSGLGPHVLAATTNGTSSNQLFGLSFDSLGCNGESVITAQYQRNLYVAGNYDSIAQDAAKGTGSHLQALAHMLSIEPQDQSAFYQLTQSHYNELFQQESVDSDNFFSKLEIAMLNDPRLAQYAIN